MLNRDLILKAEDMDTRKVPVPEWGGDLYIRAMTGTERDAFENEAYGPDGERGNVRAKFLVRCICDENGKRIFTDKDAAELGKKSYRVLNRLFSVAQNMNGIGRDAEEELEKN